ncbi:MAG TPA: PIN domain-containing protein [Stellaceae bacterium]|nr:PIN domain-containing protein [Stellaceae bacterium]
MRVALDTNILAYAEGVNGVAMQQTALALIAGLPDSEVSIPVQALGELFNVLTRRAFRPRQAARDIILGWRDGFALLDTSEPVMLAAADLATDHQIPIWDAVVLAAAAENECRLLLSEDFQDGFTWRGVTVTNPFASPRHPLLEVLLNIGPMQ